MTDDLKKLIDRSVELLEEIQKIEQVGWASAHA